MRLFAVLLTIFIGSIAHGKEPKTRQTVARTGPYLGVQPGANDLAPGKTEVRSRGAIQIVTWVGFQMITQGGRVFIQSTEPPRYDVVPSDPKSVVIEFTNSRLHSKNESRPLDTTWFPTAVESVTAKQHRGNKTRVTIKLRQIVGYDLRQQGNYLFLDFRPPTKPITVTKPNPKAKSTP
jgi:hypothetical protein